MEGPRVGETVPPPGTNETDSALGVMGRDGIV